MIELWLRWYRSQPAETRQTIAEHCIRHLIDDGVIGFQMDDYVDRNGDKVPEDGEFREFLYWKESGDEVGA